MLNAEENDIFVEMLEVFINTILYVREVYPAAIFRKRKMYSTAVFASIYPKLNDYLVKVLTTAHNLKKQNKLIKLELVIYKRSESHTSKRNEHILEKYVFEVDVNATNDWKNSDSTRTPDQYLIEFEQDVRNALLHFAKMAKTLKRLDCGDDGEDWCFRIELVTTESTFIELTNRMNNTNEHFSWIRDKNRERTPKNSWNILPIAKTHIVNVHIQTMAN